MGQILSERRLWIQRKNQDELMVYGSQAEVAAGLGQWIKDGMGEVLAHPLLDPANREGSLASAFAAIARAARQVA
jgi:hypothetical protein